jgi:hypothetical protein
MIMRVVKWFPCLVLVFAPLAFGAESPLPPPATNNPAAELEQLIHKTVVAKMPEVIEENSGWGNMIPLPPVLRRPNLPRMVVDVDGRPMVPDGPWRRLRLRLPDPDRDLRIKVHGLERLDATKYRLTLDADAALDGKADLQRWRNGILLADTTLRTRVALNVYVECDLTAHLDTGGLRLEPELKDVKLTIKDFAPERVILKRAGIVVEGEALEGLGREVQGHLQAMLDARTPQLKKRAEEALAKALKEEKGLKATGAMLKAAGPLLKEGKEGPARPK